MLRASVVLLTVAVATSCANVSSNLQSSPGASEAPVIPLPRLIQPGSGAPFVVAADTVIFVPPADADALRIGRYLSDLIGIAAGPAPLRVEPAAPGAGTRGIHLRRTAAAGAAASDESYEVTVDASAVIITAPQHAGLFYGVQTLRQLMPAFVEYEAVRADKGRPVQIAAVRIADSPRFEWRGAMLDVARHFFAVDEVKRYIDLITLYKINRLHLHLADDQGWRIDIRSWPNLTALGAETEVGGGTGGYYTGSQYAEIVNYARDRFVTIVPEIDMPGHTNAALASYAELNCDGKIRSPFTGIEVGFSALCVDKEVTYRFIDDVVREVAAMTPGPYFHIGGDEVKTLTPAQYVQFIERVQKIVQAHGKRMVGWDEIAPAALLPSTIVQHWRPDGSPAAAVAKGAKVIMSVANRAYLDMKYDSSTPIGLNWAANIEVRDAYDWDPASVASDVPEGALLGVEAPIWTETIANIRDLEFLAFPRLPALAEIGWTAREARDWERFRQRLGAHGPRFTALGVNFYRAPSVPWK